ncbi:unnamed protein product [Ilex paraguariensis]|uniref:Precursor of CEP9 n=1 Tax=Ilex paraguariensis TaxID=185542 RepID=A0ABC8TBH5_9AQUA
MTKDFKKLHIPINIEAFPMAKLQTICYCAFLLAVIACHETLFTEGRDLTSKKEASPPVETTKNLGFGSSAAVFKDDFRPTRSGSSPGEGHAFTGHGDIDTKPKALGNAPGVDHSVAGNTDDFPPTYPDHSPGVGHSFQTKIAEPNA